MYCEKFNLLFQRAPEMANAIIDAAKELIQYSNFTIEEQLLIQARDAGCNISNELIQQKNIDKVRMHDNACLACNDINNIALSKGMNKIFDFNLEQNPNLNRSFQRFSPDNHAVVAHYVATFVNEYYNMGTLELGRYGRTLDDITFNKVNKVKDYDGVTETTLPNVRYEEYKMDTLPLKSQNMSNYNEKCDIKKLLKENPEGIELTLANGVKLKIEANQEVLQKTIMDKIMGKEVPPFDFYDVTLETRKRFRDTSNVLMPETIAGFIINPNDEKQCIGFDIHINQIQEIVKLNNGFSREDYIAYKNDLER